MIGLHVYLLLGSRPWKPVVWDSDDEDTEDKTDSSWKRKISASVSSSGKLTESPFAIFKNFGSKSSSSVKTETKDLHFSEKSTSTSSRKDVKSR